ncbi:MAG: SDR family oxidoreductase [Gemmatimonadaceae bacterium]
MASMVCLVTGATGLLGRAVIDELLGDTRVARVYGLARVPRGVGSERVIPIAGDLRLPGLGLSAGQHAALAAEVNTILHLGATTTFSQTLVDARATNREGTRHLLELTRDWTGVTRWIYVSTAFVAGARTGHIAENDTTAPRGWINAYEQSKFEAEQLVRRAATPWAIVRPSTIVCDDASGRISQVNAVHRALRLYFSGLAAMLPSTELSTLDAVTTDHVARAIACVALAPDAVGTTYQACAGAGAMPLGQLLNETYRLFDREPAWRRKGIARPERVDLHTYRLFERAIEDAGSPRVRQAVRSLSHFVPQIAHPKCFGTTNTDRLLGYPAPTVASFWTNMVEAVVGSVGAREVA